MFCVVSQLMLIASGRTVDGIEHHIQLLNFGYLLLTVALWITDRNIQRNYSQLTVHLCTYLSFHKGITI